jgi:hypothetical protein
MGYTDFDTTYHFDETGAQVGPDHYFYSATKGDRANRPLPSLYSAPQLIDVLAHKVIIFYNDDAAGGPNETPFGFMRFLFSGLDMGASAWILSRNLGDAALSDERGTEKSKSINFMMRFGISMVVCEGWLNGLFFSQPPYFNEEFIGAYSNIEGYPHLTVDYGPGSRLDRIYSTFFIDPTHIMEALPEIGVGTRTQFSAPLYLYLSKDGDLSFFHGKVNGVLQQLGDMRTACFMFTPLAMEQPAMLEVFNTVIPWLSEKFDGSEKVSLKNVPAYETSFSSISERRARLDRFLEYMSEEASPEEKAFYGMGDLKPFVVTPVEVDK